MQIIYYLEICRLKCLHQKSRRYVRTKDEINLGAWSIGKGQFRPKMTEIIMKDYITEFINFIRCTLQKN